MSCLAMRSVAENREAAGSQHGRVLMWVGSCKHQSLITHWLCVRESFVRY